MPALTLLSERWLDVVLLNGLAADGGGADYNAAWTLPAGIGDLAFIEGWIQCRTIATVVANPELLGCAWTVRNPATSVVDIIGVSRWQKTLTSTLETYVSPDPLVLVRQNETIHLLFPELDTNGAPTGDVDVYFKMVRVRPVEGPQAAIQLVR